MQALVLDFDGVISDSVRESFTVSLRSYLDLRPNSPLAEREREDLYPAFLELMPLGNRAEDYGTAVTAIETGRALTDQEGYDAFRAAQDPEWLERYHRRFYEVRTELAGNDPDGWLGLMRPYAPFLDLLRRRAGNVDYAIATSKDLRSVEASLSAYGASDLFSPNLIMDKETGASKTAHLQRLRELLGLDYTAMTFVDDKVNHLDAVAPLGVRCALATWGYNGPREHELARQRGYLLCTLDEAERQLFDTAER
jgi:phosphoglycolate phosphatase-like HAD superfamily hydrolase